MAAVEERKIENKFKAVLKYHTSFNSEMQPWRQQIVQALFIEDPYYVEDDA